MRIEDEVNGTIKNIKISHKHTVYSPLELIQFGYFHGSRTGES